MPNVDLSDYAGLLIFGKVKFGYIDPSDTLSKFKMNMNFTVNEGFGIVNRIE